MMSDDEQEMIRVIAPATLAANYTFDVTLSDGEPFTVVVPKGGVKEGQEFEVPYTSNGKREEGVDDDDDDRSLMRATTSAEAEESGKIEPTSAKASKEGPDGDDHVYGKWRTSLCSCCDVVTQSTFWMSLCCIPVVLAQLVTRLRLRWNGKEANFDSNNESLVAGEVSLSFNRIVMTFLFALALSNAVPGVGHFIILIFYMIISIWIGGNIRNHVRKKYNIPRSTHKYLTCCCNNNKKDGIIDDRCMMFFCSCCSTIQLARHTHNDKEYPGYACTTTGLELGAPSLP